MLQKIPFFELFTTLTLPWEDRLALEGACLTAVEVEREKRTLAMALTTTVDLGEGKDRISAAVAAAYDLEKVSIHQTVSAPVQSSAKSGGNAVSYTHLRAHET